ncbi:MAG: hypothetical protein ACRD2C_04740 [Acidimicrobiales bacterium]
MLGPVIFTMKVLWNRLQMLREDDRGMTTEAIVVTALLVAAAIIVIGIVTAAVQNRANSIADDVNP